MGGSREGELASALLHGSVQTSPPALEIRESFPDLETCLLFSESWLWVFFFLIPLDLYLVEWSVLRSVRNVLQ